MNPENPKLDDLTAVILAGGVGSRLQSVVADRPKVLADVLGKPFIEYLFDKLEASGVKRAVLCAGFMAELLEAAYSNGYGGLEISVSRESEPLGTGGAIRHALPLMTTNLALVLNGDSFCTADFAAFRAAFDQGKLDRAMLLTHVKDCRDYGRVEIDAAGRITEYIEKGETKGSGWANAGAYLLSREAIASIPADRALSVERDVFPAWIEKGMLGVPLDGTFLDIGTPERYARAEDYFAALKPAEARR